MTDTTPLETKGAGGDTARAFDEFLEAFEAFKQTNDQRLAEIERRGISDALIDEKLARIEETLDHAKRIADNLALKSARPPLASGAFEPASQLTHKAAFEGYVRRGDATRLARIEEKALSAASGPDGGYLVPPETEAAVNRALKAISPIRAIAGVRQVSGSVYKRPFATSGADTGWVAETASRAQTATPVLAELQFPTMELYAMPAASPDAAR
jgi:HK97 family phage major capsid protein